MSFLQGKNPKHAYVKKSPLSEALPYHELNFTCPHCGILVIFPRHSKEHEGETVLKMRCPKCHERLKVKIAVERIDTDREERWNPSRR